MDHFGVGIDGCRGGWIIAIYQNGQMTFQLIEKIEQLKTDRLTDKVLIDMPIGLPTANCASRKIDHLLKPKFGKFHARVFLVPHRDMVFRENYHDANRLSKKRFGKGISKQSWYIFPKIKELDQYLQNQPEKNRQIFESHPELCFASHHDGKVITQSKKTPEGLAIRIQIIQKKVKNIEEQIAELSANTPRSKVQVDDFLDAAILAIHAVNPTKLDFVSEIDPVLQREIAIWC